MKNTSMNRRQFGTLFVVAGAAVLAPIGSIALALDAGQVAHRINKADRMSMLAERIAKAVALIRVGVDVEIDMVQLQESHDEFDDILLGFQKGEGESGVTKERIVRVEDKIKAVEHYWAPMRIAVEEIIEAGKVDDEHLELVLAHDIELEHASHEVVRALEEAYGGVDLDLGMALSIDIAGRQRMLTQKMAKDLAFAAMGYHVEEAHEDFEKNRVKFGKIIDVLLTGGGGIMTISNPPTKEAADALERVKAHWLKMEPLALELSATKTPSAEQVADFAHEAEELLEEADAVVSHYEAFVAGKV